MPTVEKKTDRTVEGFSTSQCPVCHQTESIDEYNTYDTIWYITTDRTASLVQYTKTKNMKSN